MRAALEVIRRRLPPGWRLQEANDSRLLALIATDGRHAEMTMIPRWKVSPRDVAALVRHEAEENTGLLIVAPFLSERSRELLAEAGASYADATGNLRLVTSTPAVFLESQGAERDPAESDRSLKSLKGASAGRVVRALCDFKPPYGVRELAAASSTPLGTVSRVVSLLDREALIKRNERKQIAFVDWQALIAFWTRDYNVRTSNRQYSYLEPRGFSTLVSKLRRLPRYAATGSLVGPSIAPTRLAMIYVDRADSAAEALELVPAEAGANVWLLEPYDDVVYERISQVHVVNAPSTEIVAAARTQVVADLLTSPGRGPEEARALIEKMRGSENAWRQEP
jgi:hypothetical protein